jgi:hypothetical protein
VVSTAEGRELAESRGCLFLESSAKRGEGVEDVFEKLVDQVNGGSYVLAGFLSACILTLLVAPDPRYSVIVGHRTSVRSRNVLVGTAGGIPRERHCRAERGRLCSRRVVYVLTGKRVFILPVSTFSLSPVSNDYIRLFCLF